MTAWWLGFAPRALSEPMAMSSTLTLMPCSPVAGAANDRQHLHGRTFAIYDWANISPRSQCDGEVSLRERRVLGSGPIRASHAARAAGSKVVSRFRSSPRNRTTKYVASQPDLCPHRPPHLEPPPDRQRRKFGLYSQSGEKESPASEKTPALITTRPSHLRAPRSRRAA